MKIDHEKYIDIAKIRDHIGDEICKILPQFHAITGCDTTSYMFNVGKIKALKQIMKNPELIHLISEIGNENGVSQENLENARTFVQMVMYSGKYDESYVDTRVRLYKKMKQKSSASLPPDPASLKQAILRAHLQAHIWKQCLKPMVVELSVTDYGWIRNNTDITPLWFEGNQLPPSLRRQKRVRKNNQTSNTDDADDESDSSGQTKLPPTKKAKVAKKMHTIDTVLYDADCELSDIAHSILKPSESENESNSSQWESDFSSSDDQENSDSDYLPF